MTNATLKVYGGDVSLNVDGNPLAVEILYRGVFEGESKLPNGFLSTGNKGRIIIIRMTQQQFPESLFSYRGEFSPKRITVYKENFKLVGKIDVPSYKWQHQTKTTNTWNSESSNWQNYYEQNPNNLWQTDAEAIKRKADGGFTEIITNNIKSVSGNLVTKDGEPYYGDVHFHSGGYFMTGATHSEESVRLYRKNRIRIRRRK
tara:strand:- start:1102 stop:1707 length:606 start_codon:yes stop_codon:yes gene_type:complete